MNMAYLKCNGVDLTPAVALNVRIQLRREIFRNLVEHGFSTSSIRDTNETQDI